MQKNLIAIGDVHGCVEELNALLASVPLRPSSTLVFLGDYIDRGPHSRRVVERVIELRREFNVVTLRGNHEAMMLEFLDGTDWQKVARFVLNGGSATLASYANSDGVYTIPDEHIAFFNELLPYYETEDCFFVHAGVPDAPLANVDVQLWAEAMAWIRGEFLRSTYQWEKLIVHGHTPVANVEVAANRINLDTGCVYGRSLSAMEFPSHQVYSVDRYDVTAPSRLRDGTRRATVRFHGAIPVTLHVNGTAHPFETIDYSELGIGVRPLRKADASRLQIGTKVSGLIGPNKLFQIPFAGEVVRSMRFAGTEVFGIRIELENADAARMRTG